MFVSVQFNDTAHGEPLLFFIRALYVLIQKIFPRRHEIDKFFVDIEAYKIEQLKEKINILSRRIAFDKKRVKKLRAEHMSKLLMIFAGIYCIHR